MSETQTPDYPLHEAAKANQVLLVRSLLAENPKLVLQRDLDGRSALHWAVSRSHEEIVSLLLNPFDISMAGLSGSVESSGKTHKRFEIEIDELTDDSDWTPLHIAASVGNLDILLQLLTHKPAPDVNLATNTGTTALHLAVAKAYVDVVEELIRAGASSRLKDKRGQYPLHRAASTDNVQIVQLIVETGKANVSSKDVYGWTPLHYALAEGHADVARLLVKLGADTEAVNTDGERPIDVASDDLKKSFAQRAK